MRVHEGVEADGEKSTFHPSGLELFHFWEAARGVRPAPNRDVLDLKRIRRLLPALFILEHGLSPGSLIWRLAGTGVCSIFAGELTGTDVFDGWKQAERDIIGNHLFTVITAQRPALLRFRLTTDRGQAILADMAAFPVVAADGHTPQVLGGLFDFADDTRKQYAAIRQREVLSARFCPTASLARLASDAPEQARHRFRVISGGLNGG